MIGRCGTTKERGAPRVPPGPRRTTARSPKLGYDRRGFKVEVIATTARSAAIAAHRSFTAGRSVARDEETDNGSFLNTQVGRCGELLYARLTLVEVIKPLTICTKLLRVRSVFIVFLSLLSCSA